MQAELGSDLMIPDGFDTRVHLRDPKTGRIIKEQHYKLSIINGVQVYQRDDKFFWPNGVALTSEEVARFFPGAASAALATKEEATTEASTPKKQKNETLETKKIDVNKLAS